MLHVEKCIDATGVPAATRVLKLRSSFTLPHRREGRTRQRPGRALRAVFFRTCCPPLRRHGDDSPEEVVQFISAAGSGD